MLRAKERFDFSPCSSDGMRVDAWLVALQGSRDFYFLPARVSYKDYYLRSEVGKQTLFQCNTVFRSSHSFATEMLFYGGLPFFVFLIFLSWKWWYKTKTPLWIGFYSFLIFLSFAPTYPIFLILLFFWFFVLFDFS